jgi:hypothetical protein
MLRTGWLISLFLSLAGTVGAAAADISPIPAGYKRVWSDEFTSLSLRSGGPTFNGLQRGSGTWSAPGAWNSNDPRGFAGYGGYDWFVDPSYYGWPAGYHGQLTITNEGLRIRSEPPLSRLSALLPKVDGNGWAGADTTTHGGIAPWLSGQILNYNAVRIKPPFYVEVRAKMPIGAGRPFSAIWIGTAAHFYPHRNDHGKEYEIDIQEGFGDANALHTTIHWNDSAITHDYPAHNVVDSPIDRDLSADFNVWGCLITKEHQIFYFNGLEVGRMDTPPDANIDQPFGMIFDVSAGLPWNGGGPPSGGPHDMIIRYVRYYAPNANGLTIEGTK